MKLGSLATYACEGNEVISLAGRMFATIYAWVPTAAAIIGLLFGLLHRLLLRTRSRTYGGSSLEQQLVTATHALFTVLYAIQIVPYTILVCRILFADDFLQSLIRWYQGAFVILDSHLVLYAFEGALRVVARPNWLLLLHHVCFFGITATGFFARSFFVLKLGLIFDCMATYEVLLFATLMARRLGASHAAVRAMLAAGIFIYAATRVLQLVVLIPFFKGSYGQLAGCGGLGVWSAMLVLTSILLIIQAYTFRIYAGVWRRHAPGLPASGFSSARLGHTTEGSSISLSHKPSDSAESVLSDSV
ncbi:hypothetical protein ABPG75_006163 [Micractinium tetrahymenae]